MPTIQELMDKVNKIKIEEFLEALNIMPVKREGNILTYNAPYALDLQGADSATFGKPTCLVDTDRNLWRDKKFTTWQPLIMLAYDMTGYYNRERLVYYVLNKVADFRKRFGDEVNRHTAREPKQGDGIVPKKENKNSINQRKRLKI